jgi:hypothetical protein
MRARRTCSSCGHRRMCDRSSCDRCSVVETYIEGLAAIATITQILASPALTAMLVAELEAVHA